MIHADKNQNLPKDIYFEYYKTQDPKLREQIILKNLKIVHKIKSKYLGKGVSEETLYSIGCIGLIQAVDRFNPHLGAQFSTLRLHSDFWGNQTSF